MKMRRIEMGFSGPDMTPMIDIVFLLFTFFMITINFENTKDDERVKLPKDALARPPAVKPEHELVLNFGYQRDATGNRLNTVPEIFYNEQFIEVSQVLHSLQMEKRVLEQIHGKHAIKDVTVLIRADSEVPAGLVQELIKKCQETGFCKFSLRATSEES